MKGIVIDCRTGQANLIEDSKPEMPVLPWDFPQGLDLIKAREDIENLKSAATGKSAGAMTLGGDKKTGTGLLSRIKNALS